MADLAESVKGELRPALEALRDALAKELQKGAACSKCGGPMSSPTAPLAKQLRDTLNQIESLAKPRGSKTDDLKKQRAKRQAGVAKRPSGGNVERAGGGRARS